MLSQGAISTTDFPDAVIAAPGAVCEAQKRATLEKDIRYAMYCLEESGKHPGVVSAAREIILRDEGILMLSEMLGRLYAEAGVAAVGLPKSVLQPHKAHALVKECEELNKCCHKKKEESTENEATPEMTPC